MGKNKGGRKTILCFIFRFHYSTGCRYNAVQYKTTLCTVLEWLKQNIDQSLPQKKNHPYLAVMGELYIVVIIEKIDRVMTVLHGISVPRGLTWFIYPYVSHIGAIAWLSQL